MWEVTSQKSWPICKSPNTKSIVLNYWISEPKFHK